MRGKIVYRRYCVFVTATFFCPEDSCCGEVPGGRGVLLGILGGGVPPALQILTLLQTQKCHFHTPESELASKIHIRFQTWPLRNYVINTKIRTATKTIS